MPDVLRFFVGFPVVISGLGANLTGIKQFAHFVIQILSAQMELVAENMQHLLILPEKFLKPGSQIQIKTHDRWLFAPAASRYYNLMMN